jgi:hypothetical protein
MIKLNKSQIMIFRFPHYFYFDKLLWIILPDSHQLIDLEDLPVTFQIK